MLGLVSLLTEAIGIEGFQHVQEKVAEAIIAVEIVKALCALPRPTRRPTSSGS